MNESARGSDWVILPTVVRPVVEERRPVLLWVYTGGATVTAAGVDYRLSAGRAIWVPPGVRHGMRSDPGSVVVPIGAPVEAVTTVLSQVRVVSIPPGWESWLIHQSIDTEHIGRHVHDALPGRRSLIELVQGAHERAEHRGVDRLTDSRALTLPRSPAAWNVARRLLRDPGVPASADSLAADEKVSVKTLQRQFLTETGLTYSQWRTRARIRAAEQCLAEGCDIGWTASTVGYATAAGFTRAFQRHVGATPREYLRCTRKQPRGVVCRPEDVAGHTTDLASGAASEPPRIPHRRAWTRINPGHFLLWAYRGEVDVRVGNRSIRLHQGEATWVPAHVPNTIEYAPDSIAIPVGDSFAPVMPDVEALGTFSFPREAEAFLLHTSIVEYTRIRRDTEGPSFTEELFRAQFIANHAGAAARRVSGHSERITATLRRDPADSRSIRDWARHLQISPRALGEEFRQQTGETLPRWRAQLRMTVARHLLSLGDPPGAVHRRLGYASPAGFSNAFVAAHGISPRDYQRRDTGDPERTDV